jgi:hypothetical protein
MRTFKTVTTQELTAVVCDGCGLQASTDGDYEFHEFISIGHHCGYDGQLHQLCHPITSELPVIII